MKDSGRATDPPRIPLAPDPTRNRLTAREQEIALLVGDGLKDVLIARRLGLSLSTVSTYVRRIQQRLKFTDRDVLAAWVAARRNRDHPEARLRRGRDELVT